LLIFKRESGLLLALCFGIKDEMVSLTPKIFIIFLDNIIILIRRNKSPMETRPIEPPGKEVRL
jgi:hypothetical protein